jgi:hypothetical protein
MGETLRGQYRTTVGPNLVQTNDVLGIVLCVENLQNYIANKGWKATLPKGYDTGTFVKPGPDPDAYSSASGTLVHEMVHFRDWNYCRLPPGSQLKLGRTQGNSTETHANRHGPDHY